MKGLSPRNLGYMKAFAEAWPEDSILQQAAAKLPWFHNCIILDKIKAKEERIWYLEAAIEYGWSRNILAMQIESDLYRRQGKATTNFQTTFPKPQSDLAQQLLKDPYNFDFLTLSKDAHERELETGLVGHIQKFLLELGVGFAFVGRQVPLEVAGEDYRIDLLFYHLKLRCFVVFDLKGGAFKPEYTGKMNFYLSAVDDLLRHPDDNLRDMTKPLGVAEFTHLEKLPEEFKGTLPTIEEIEAELGTSDESET